MLLSRRISLLFPLLYLALIAGAELITSLLNPIGGITFHIILLLSLLLHSSFEASNLSRLYLSLSLTPLIGILSLSTPLTHLSILFWYVVVSIPLILGAIMVIRRLELSPEEIGLSWGRLRIQLPVALTGFLFGFMEYYILKKPDPFITRFSPGDLIPSAVLIILTTGFLEELIFRGILQKIAIESMEGWGLFYVALLFAILHIGYLSVLDFIFVFFVGLFFGVIVRRTKSLLGVSLSHGITNVILYLVLPFFL